MEASSVTQVALQWDIHLEYLLLDSFVLWEKIQVIFVIAVVLVHSAFRTYKTMKLKG